MSQRSINGHPSPFGLWGREAHMTSHGPPHLARHSVCPATLAAQHQRDYETTYKHNGFTRSAIAPSPVPTPAHSRVCLPVGRAVHRRRARRRDGPHATRGTRRAACARARAHHPLRGAQTNSTCSRTSPPPSRTCPGDPGPEPDCPPLSRADGPRAATDGPAAPPAAPPVEGGGIPGRHWWSPMTIRSTLA